MQYIPVILALSLKGRNQAADRLSGILSYFFTAIRIPSSEIQLLQSLGMTRSEVSQAQSWKRLSELGLQAARKRYEAGDADVIGEGRPFFIQADNLDITLPVNNDRLNNSSEIAHITCAALHTFPSHVPPSAVSPGSQARYESMRGLGQTASINDFIETPEEMEHMGVTLQYHVVEAIISYHPANADEHHKIKRERLLKELAEWREAHLPLARPLPLPELPTVTERLSLPAYDYNLGTLDGIRRFIDQSNRSSWGLKARSRLHYCDGRLLDLPKCLDLCCFKVKSRTFGTAYQRSLDLVSFSFPTQRQLPHR